MQSVHPAFPYVSPQVAFLFLSLSPTSLVFTPGLAFSCLLDSPCGLKRLFIPASTSIQVQRFTLRKVEGGVSSSARELGSVRFRSGEQPPEDHGARIALCLNARYRTESFAFFTVRLGVNQKTGLQMHLNAHLLSSGHFFAPLFYREDDPEALTLNYVNAGYNRL